MDKSGADAFGEAIFYLISSILILSIVLKVIITLIVIFWNKRKGVEQPETIQSKLVGKITSTAYGILSGYYISLFLTNFLENYQPAWEAYIIYITVAVVFFLLSFLILKSSRYKSFCWLKNLL